MATLTIETPMGWLTDDEARTLFVLAASLPEKPVIVEIGSWMGKSTVIMGTALKSTGKKGTIYCVDPWEATGDKDYVKALADHGMEPRDLYPTFIQNMEKHGLLDIVVPCRGRSEEAAEWLTLPEIDLLFIDGDHHEDAALLDLQLWVPKVKVGGIVAMHDFYSPEMLQLVEPELGIPGPYVAFTKYCDYAWLDAMLVNTLFVARRGFPLQV